MDWMFNECVKLLEWLAGVTGCSYMHINVILFVFLMPSVFLAMVCYIVFLRIRIRNMRHSLV